MEATNSSLKQHLHELQEKLDSQLREQSEICTPNSQLAACNFELTQEAGANDGIKADIKTFRGKLLYTVIQIKTYAGHFQRDILGYHKCHIEVTNETRRKVARPLFQHSRRAKTFLYPMTNKTQN